MYGFQPEYLSGDINLYLTLINFTYLSKNLLIKPRIWFQTYDERYFAFATQTCGMHLHVSEDAEEIAFSEFI